MTRVHRTTPGVVSLSISSRFVRVGAREPRNAPKRLKLEKKTTGRLLSWRRHASTPRDARRRPRHAKPPQVKPPEFAEEVLREVRERPGLNDNHRDELMVQERRMLDEHFFLYNDVPDTGMCQCRTSTCASIWGVSGSAALWVSLGGRGRVSRLTGRCPRRHVAAVRLPAGDPAAGLLSV